MKRDKGFTLLIAIVVTSMMLIVSFVVANVALKQLVLADAGVESQYAFYNADSGADCAIYWDLRRGNNGISPFATSTAGSISCGTNTVTTGSQTVSTVPTQTSVVGGGGGSNPTSIFQLDYTKGCAIVRVTKRNDGYTQVDSRGYNNCNTTAIKRYERGITVTYQGDENTITGSSGNLGTISHIFLSQSSFNFSALAGVTPASQSLTISNTGSGSMNWSGTPNQSWCRISPSSGSLNSGGSVTASVSVDSASASGTYSCTIPISSASSDNSPQNISVTYNVSPSLGHIVLSQSSFSFSASVGATPASQSLTISNTGSGSMNWSGTPNQSWCRISPSSGSLNSGGSVTASVSVDSASASGTYSCTIPISSSNVDNSPQNIAVTDTVSSVYVCATPSGSYSDLSSGNYKIYKFTGNGTLNVTCPGTVEYLLVGGGGGGGTDGGGGGGGGGFITGTKTIANASYSIVVGAGGTTNNSWCGNPGGNSTALGLTAIGGGQGGGSSCQGQNGGSGGGGSWYGPLGQFGGSAGGSGTSGQGFSGGNGDGRWNGAGGGGGGAGGAGQNAGDDIGGNGGSGKASSITGVSVMYAGGGGGGYDPSYTGYGYGLGGSGGGGKGEAYGGASPSTSGTDGLGGGGGGGQGGYSTAAARGGNGVVIIKYQYK